MAEAKPMTKQFPTTVLGGLAAAVCLIGLLPAAHAQGQPTRVAKAESAAKQPTSEVALANVYFTPGDAYLTGDTRDALDQIVQAAQQRRIHRIEVHGHSDERGKSGINFEMSQLRAKRVAAYLVKRGIDPSVVTARSYGKLYPMVVGATTDEQHQQNRRTSIQIEWSRPSEP